VQGIKILHAAVVKHTFEDSILVASFVIPQAATKELYPVRS